MEMRFKLMQAIFLVYLLIQYLHKQRLRWSTCIMIGMYANCTSEPSNGKSSRLMMNIMTTFLFWAAFDVPQDEKISEKKNYHASSSHKISTNLLQMMMMNHIREESEDPWNAKISTRSDDATIVVVMNLRKPMNGTNLRAKTSPLFTQTWLTIDWVLCLKFQVVCCTIYATTCLRIFKRRTVLHTMWALKCLRFDSSAWEMGWANF